MLTRLVRPSSAPAIVLCAAVVACGDGALPGEGGGGQGGGAGQQSASVGTSAAPQGVTTSGAGGASAIDDPDLDGPFTVTELDAGTSSPSGNTVPIHVAFPSGGPEPSPYPVVIVAHGFQLPASQYFSYVRRLASHGFVALTADYPAGFTGVNNVDNAVDLIAALDWTASAPELAGSADANVAGMTGHSMGGKLSLLAATMDPRVRASLTLDPVDGSMSCSPADCPDVSALMPLDIPTAFLGETIDATGSFMACAPAADNYATFYAGTTSPSLMVTVIGANHMSFLDDVGSCGLVCSFCNPATVDNATVNALSRAFTVAFYRRYLKDEVGYDAYLTGAEAQARYVATGLVEIESK